MQSLDECCVARILSLTTPRDACRAAAVSSVFRSAVESDTVWEKFLPASYREIIDRVVGPGSLLNGSISKKELYFRLCDPVLIDGGCKTFSLEKSSGNIIYMLSAKELAICCGEDDRYWRWPVTSASRFSEVVELLDVCRLDVNGRIDCKALSPKIVYGVYLVFKLMHNAYGLHSIEVSVAVRDQVSKDELSLQSNDRTHRLFQLYENDEVRDDVDIEEEEEDSVQNENQEYVEYNIEEEANIEEDHDTEEEQQQLQGEEQDHDNEEDVYFEDNLNANDEEQLQQLMIEYFTHHFHQYDCPPRTMKCSKQWRRCDGWMEVELGEFFNEGDDGEVSMRFRNISGHWKSGLVIQGIEVRPKS